jgi:hypothetical protein
MRVRIRGKYYTLRFGRPMPGSDGHADPQAKEIVVSSRLRGERKMDVLIHELLHFAHWDLDEAAIEETASDIAKILWRLGYRESDPDR